ncbi:MAG: N-acetylmuramic acid 6-phosphate etherase [Candidatus Puniceispirillales bacterium]
MMHDETSTESIPHQSRWLDTLDDAAAVDTMAADQITAARAVAAAAAAIEAAAAAVFARLKASPESRLFYAGAGTSARIGVQDGVELTPTFGWPQQRTGYLIAGGTAALTQSIEGAEDNTEAAMAAVTDAGIGQHDVVIGIAASGSTPYTCAAVTAAKTAGALTVGIANNSDAPLVAAADCGITLITGSESVAGSTRMKAGTAQKICLNIISTLVMVRMGKVRNGLMVGMQATNEKLRRRQQKIDALLKDQ